MSAQGPRADGLGGAAPGGAGISRRRWIWDHIGRISGAFLALVAFALLVLLAALGWPPAYGLVVLIVIGVVMIALGGRIKEM